MALILLAAFGVCLVVAGLAMVSVPVAMVAAGVFCVLVAYLVAEGVR